jgi:hypothetical protein
VRQSLLTCLPLAQAGARAEAETSALQTARPYQYTPAEQLIANLDKVAEQIHRFAGEQTYSPPTVIREEWCSQRL